MYKQLGNTKQRNSYVSSGRFEHRSAQLCFLLLDF